LLLFGRYVPVSKSMEVLQLTQRSGLFTGVRGIGILGSSYRKSCIYSPPRGEIMPSEGLHAA
jgi:hypothetical protein